MAEMRAPGLRASWLNGWLAAVGITVLVEGARLRWSGDVVPVAILDVPNTDDVAAAVAAALPSRERLEAMAIARPRLERKVTLTAFAAAAEVARRTKDFSLAASVTDLVAVAETDELPHGPFDTGAPQGLTLWDRLRACRDKLTAGPSLTESVARSLDGRGVRQSLNGLGFDYVRIAASADPPTKFVDPVVECLAFFGLRLLVVRGDGRASDRGVRPRGWRLRRGGDGRNRWCFSWPVWCESLDRWAIDALLGQVFREDRTERWPRLAGLGVTQAYESRAFEWSGSDTTRGYASRRVV